MCRPSDPQEAKRKSCWWTRSTSFLGEDFHGKLFGPCLMLESKVRASLFLKIWAHLAEAVNWTVLFGKTEKTEEYKALAEKYPNWDVLVRKQVCQMCRDVRHFEDPLCVYDPVHDRVSYVHMDCANYGGNVGYRQAFAYLLHSTAPREACMWAALVLQIPCGKFSNMNINPAPSSRFRTR